MPLIIVSFLAGVLTVAAPCILPVLPVVLGTATATATTNRRRPLIIIGSLAASVFVFTLLLKATTTLLGVPQELWQFISGGIVIALGVIFLMPQLWEHVASSLNKRATQALSTASTAVSDRRDILTGAALGPVFNSCSPTYALIIATILPAEPLTGLLYLLAYVAGLATALTAIAWLGQSLVTRLGWAANPRGWFHRAAGIVLIITGLAIVFGYDKLFQAYVLEQGWYDAIANLEKLIR